MKSTEKVQLIEGNFTPAEAKELLLNLIGSKIQFHTSKNFSTEICTGQPDRKSVEKIVSLRKTRERVAELLENARSKNLTVEIESSITISWTEKTELE